MQVAASSGGPTTSTPHVARRAAQALAMLVGFYALAAAIVLAVLAIDIVYAVWVTGAVVQVWIVSGFVIFPIVRLVFLTRREPETAVAGLALRRADEPVLWQTIDRLSAAAGVRGPDEVVLTDSVNAAVDEQTRLLGLVGGHRRLVVGAPLLIGLTVAQFEAVLGHELGHYSHRDVRLAAVTVAGRAALIDTVNGLDQRAAARDRRRTDKLQTRSDRRVGRGRKATSTDPGVGVDRVLAVIFGRYAQWYFRVSESVSRRQEFAADRISADLVGREVCLSALREVAVLDAAQALYLDVYASVGVPAGLLPPRGEVFGGLRHLLADPTRQAQLDRLRADPPDPPTDELDSHPSLAARLAAVAALPDDGVRHEATGPAIGLLADPDRRLSDLETLAVASRLLGSGRADWPELVQAGATVATTQRAEPVTTALRAAGHDPTLDGWLAAAGTGRIWTVADALPKSPEAARVTGRAAREFARPGLRDGLSALVVLHLVRAGRARWHLAWADGPTLVLDDDLVDTLTAALDTACTDAADTGPLRALLAADPSRTAGAARPDHLQGT